MVYILGTVTGMVDNAKMNSGGLMPSLGKLIQLFQNLIINVIKFYRTEPPRIHLTSGRKSADWVFSVKDKGVDIKMKYLDRIFLIFQRLQGRNKYTGTGIGLEICKKIVARQGDVRLTKECLKEFRMNNNLIWMHFPQS